jgi:ubiquinone/menaquinone biosynthesis C-methylase UbiE
MAIFVMGFVWAPLGMWTGPVLGAWFVGTQKAGRGFVLLAGINFLLSLPSAWRGSEPNAAGWSLLAALLGTLPFLLYRLVSRRRPAFLSTLALPLWGVALAGLGPRFLPARLFQFVSVSAAPAAPSPLWRVFLVYWLAAVITWMWSLDFQADKVAAGAVIFAVAYPLAFVCSLAHPVRVTAQTGAGIALLAVLLLTAWSFVQPVTGRQIWADKTEAVARLRSPRTGAALRVVREGRQEVLVSEAGERYPVRNGIPVLLAAETLTGSNRKYNRLYEMIGGFYDDAQRLSCALRGIRADQYFVSYLRWLEVRPGDSVLETSVGTGLNFKYLPRGARLSGLDLSLEMLTSCQANLRRWAREADLFLGNAEELPFADNSFDVVFHTGGINFFNDRARAIREMIRVAKPGSRILIADETEEHVKATYERVPVTSLFFRNRAAPVQAPVELVPPEMQEIHLETLWRGRFYALTFRKPLALRCAQGRNDTVFHGFRVHVSRRA